MASFNASIDLLSLNGAKLLTGINGQDDKRVYVCVPVDLNEIRIATSRQNADKQIAGLRVSIWPLNENYKAKVRQSTLERGDNNVNIPTHEMQMNFSVDYVKTVIKVYPKLVEEVREQNKDRDPGIASQDPTNENTHLFKAIRNRMNKRLAMVYQLHSQTSPQQAYTPAYGMASGTATTYVPLTDGTSDGSSFSDYPDDLPF